jgi:hypothetical protein
MKTAQEKIGRKHFMGKRINDWQAKVKASHARFFPPGPW